VGLLTEKRGLTELGKTGRERRKNQIGLQVPFGVGKWKAVAGKGTLETNWWG